MNNTPNSTPEPEALREGRKRGHTPGPWSVKYWYQEETDTRGWDISADGHLLPMNGYETDYDDEAEANARLISAAPDLLEAVRFLLLIVQSIGEPDDNDEPGLIAARAAVAKATGGSQ